MKKDSLIKIKSLTCSRLLICRSHARHINKREQVRGLILIRLEEGITKCAVIQKGH